VNLPRGAEDDGGSRQADFFYWIISWIGMNQHQNELIRSDLIQPLIVMYVEGSIMISPFKKDKEITAKEKKRKKKQEERRKRAQARGEKPIK
jgi:hypothetical protein